MQRLSVLKKKSRRCRLRMLVSTCRCLFGNVLVSFGGFLGGSQSWKRYEEMSSFFVLFSYRYMMHPVIHPAMFSEQVAS